MMELLVLLVSDYNVLKVLSILVHLVVVLVLVDLVLLAILLQEAGRLCVRADGTSLDPLNVFFVVREIRLLQVFREFHDHKLPYVIKPFALLFGKVYSLLVFTLPIIREPAGYLLWRKTRF